MESMSSYLSRSDVKKMMTTPTSEWLNHMTRDPIRATYYDKDAFYAPSDGFVLYSKIVDPNKDIIDVKGGKYTINNLLREEIKEKCLILSIFMTFLDVHVNRLPTSGFVKYEKMPSLKVTNLSMRPIESGILEKMGVPKAQMSYSLFNEAMKNEIFLNNIKQKYYLLQIADFEVEVIAPFHESGAFYTQCERFSTVRMGSQVDLIIPFINKSIKFSPLVVEKWHVEAGIVRIIKISRN